MVDARLADGSRVNAIIPPLALDGAVLSIRRFRTDKLGADDLVGRESWTEPMKEFLEAAVACRLNIVVSGGTGAGKTTLLNILSSFIRDNERVVTIEDAAELKLRQRHVVRLETRPPNIEGKGAVRQRDLVVNALRMRPDRIIVGEVRSEEALDMLQAMNTGHDGSLTTIHANTPRDALYRLDTMVAMANLNIPEKAIRQQIASAVNLIVQVSAHGRRHAEGDGDLGDHRHGGRGHHDAGHLPVRTHRYRQDGRVRGRFRATGIRPKCAERLASAGVHLASGHVRPRQGHSAKARGHMAIVAFTFLLILAIVLGAYFALRRSRPRTFERSKLLRRLGRTAATGVLKSRHLERPTERLSNVRVIELVLSRAKGVSGPLERLVTQSGLKMTVGTLLTMSVVPGLCRLCPWSSG